MTLYDIQLLSFALKLILVNYGSELLFADVVRCPKTPADSSMPNSSFLSLGVADPESRDLSPSSFHVWPPFRWPTRGV